MLGKRPATKVDSPFEAERLGQNFDSGGASSKRLSISLFVLFSNPPNSLGQGPCPPRLAPGPLAPPITQMRKQKSRRRMDEASSLCSANRKRKCATSERFFLNNFRGNQIIRKQENIVVKLGGNCMAGMEFEYLAQQLKQPIRKLRILFVTNYYLMTNLNKFLSSPSNYFDEFFYEFNFSKDFFLPLTTASFRIVAPSILFKSCLSLKKQSRKKSGFVALKLVV